LPAQPANTVGCYNSQYLRGEGDEEDELNLVPGSWRGGNQLVDGQGHTARNTATNKAKAVREYMTEYYNLPEGAVEWQDRMIN